jgi:hypothetical protein
MQDSDDDNVQAFSRYLAEDYKETPILLLE